MLVYVKVVGISPRLHDLSTDFGSKSPLDAKGSRKRVVTLAGRAMDGTNEALIKTSLVITPSPRREGYKVKVSISAVVIASTGAGAGT